MTSAQDPFYIVKEEIQDSIDKLEATFRKWEHTPSETRGHVLLTKELLTNCESIEWQVDELDKAIDVASRDPAWYGIDEAELDRRRRWSVSAHKQVATVRKAVEARKEKSISLNGTRQELMRIQNDRSNDYNTQDDEDFMTSESDRQMLLIKRQDEELDEISVSVQKIGGIGLTIHEELVGQERILDELSTEMETTANRLDFVQDAFGAAFLLQRITEMEPHVFGRLRRENGEFSIFGTCPRLLRFDFAAASSPVVFRGSHAKWALNRDILNQDFSFDVFFYIYIYIYSK